MKTFQEFLREQAPRIRAQEAAKEAKKTSWISSVDALISQMTSWLRESDLEGILKLETRRLERTEESIGKYSVNLLFIWLGSRSVVVQPVACDVMGPMNKPREGSWGGRVDLVGPPYSCKIYRLLASNGADEWYILDEKTYGLYPLTREAFDSALLSLFA
ncbi:MAG: hypothetical protein ACLQGP_34415 [Isosphaeraceae bacterium]